VYTRAAAVVVLLLCGCRGERLPTHPEVLRGTFTLTEVNRAPLPARVGARLSHSCPAGTEPRRWLKAGEVSFEEEEHAFDALFTWEEHCVSPGGAATGQVYLSRDRGYYRRRGTVVRLYGPSDRYGYDPVYQGTLRGDTLRLASGGDTLVWLRARR